MSELFIIDLMIFKRIFKELILIEIAIFSVLFIIGPDLNAQITFIDVDVNQKFQIIDNFSASDCWWAYKIGNEWNNANKNSIADLLFSPTKGIGLSAWRFNLGAGIDPTITDPWRTAETFEVSPGVYDWTHDAGGQWFLQAAKDRGVNQFIAFVNSPPISITRNGHTYCTDNLGSTNLKDGYNDQFSKYLVDIIKHFRDSLGINFNYVSPVNEPQWDWNGNSQEGNRASDEDIKKILDSLYTELKNQNVSAKISIPESGSLSNWYKSESSISNKYGKIYGDFLNHLYLYKDTSIANETSKIFAGHSYWSDLLSTQLIQDRQSLSQYMDPFLKDGYKYWVTEYCVMQGPNGEGGNGRDLKMTTALNVARVIHYDLTVAYASAWQWWLAVSKYDYKDGLIYTNYSVPGDGQTIIPSKTLWALGNFSRFIRPGSQRIDCSGANDKNGLMASAYLDSSNAKIIIVFVNVSNDNKNIRLNFTGIDSLQNIKYMTPYITSDNSGDDLRAYLPISVDSVFNLPSRAVVTLVGLLDGSAITEVDIKKDEIPQKFFLDQNYPNPFNPTTKIKYSIPQNGFVTIKIFNLWGQEVASLVNQEQRTGEYKIEFNASNLASGMYMYRIQSGNYSSTKKMIVLK